MSDALEQQQLRDYEAFRKMEFPDDQTGKYALLRNCELVEVFVNLTAARERGEELFSDGLFSIQTINAPPAHLGMLPSTGNGIAPERARQLERQFDDFISGPRGAEIMSVDRSQKARLRPVSN